MWTVNKEVPFYEFLPEVPVSGAQSSAESSGNMQFNLLRYEARKYLFT
jgi:hypothetical protein